MDIKVTIINSIKNLHDRMEFKKKQWELKQAPT